MTKEQNKPQQIRLILIEFYKLIKNQINNNIPKIIKYKFVDQYTHDMFNILIDETRSSKNKIFQEDPETTIKRNILSSQKAKILAFRKILTSI